MYVVAGVSGNTGSVVARTLLDRGEKVRVVVRDAAKGAPWAARGAEVAVAELHDAAALERAFAGARGAYVLLPPMHASSSVLADEARVADAFVAAAKAVALPHLVMLSSLGGHLASGTGVVVSCHDAEAKLAASGVPYTVVRAGSFYENTAGAIAGARGAGVYPTFARKDLAIPSVSSKDIGRVAALALLEGPRGIIELSGPRDLTAMDLAHALGAALGKELRVNEIPDAAIVAMMTEHGLSEDMATLFRDLYRGINAGAVRFEGPPAHAVRGTVTIEEHFRAALA